MGVLIGNIIIVLFVVGFVVAFGMFLMMSFQVLFNREDKVKLESFKRKLMWSFITLVIIVLLFMGIKLVEAYYGVNSRHLPMPIRNY